MDTGTNDRWERNNDPDDEGHLTQTSLQRVNNVPVPKIIGHGTAAEYDGYFIFRQGENNEHKLVIGGFGGQKSGMCTPKWSLSSTKIGHLPGA